MNQLQYSQQFLDQSKDFYWVVDNKMQLVYANKAYLKLIKGVTGLEKKLNTPIFQEGLEEDYIKIWESYYQRALSGEKFEIEEHFYNPVAQEMQYAQTTFLPIEGENGGIQSIYCHSTEITSLVKQKDNASHLLDASLDVFCTIDEEGKFVYVSEASTEHWGYTPKELIGTSFRDLIIDEDKEKTDAVAIEIMAGRKFKAFSNRYRIKNGDTAYNLWSARWDHDAKLMYCVARDEKEKMEQENLLRQSEKRFRALVENGADAIVILGVDGKPNYVSSTIYKLLGYTEEEAFELNLFEIIHPDDIEGIVSKMTEVLQLPGVPIQGYTSRTRHKDGSWRWLEATIVNMLHDPDINGIVDNFRDVTEQKKQEAVKALLSQISQSFNKEEELIPASNRLCENLNDFGEFDLIELWCPNMEQTEIKLIGKSNQNQDFYELESPEVLFQKNQGLPGKVWEKGKQLLWGQIEINKYFVRKKGAAHLGLKALLGVPLTFNNELVGVLLIGTKRNIDYLKQHSSTLSQLEKFIGSEINRKRLENDLNHLYQAIPDIICVADFNGRFLKMNPAGCELLEYKEDEILFHSCEKFVHPEDKDISFNELEKLENSSGTFQFENRYITKSGEIIWLSWSCNSSTHEGLIYASAKNISEEVRLRELNAQAGSMAKIGSWEVNLENNTVFWSKIVHQLHETNSDSFTPDFITAFDFYREDFRPLVTKSFEKSVITGESFDFEAVIITKKLKERWVRAMGDVEIVNGKAIRIYGSFQDITDRKGAELRLHSFANNLPGVAFQYFIYPDGSDDLKYVTDGAQEVWGFDADRVMKDNNLVWNQIELGGEIEEVKNSIMKSVETKSEWKAQWRYMMPNNELRIHAGYGSPNFLPDGTVIFNSLILDITQEFRSEELLKQASEMAKIGSWELNQVDQDNDIIYWSPMTRKILEVDERHDPSFARSFDFYEPESKVIVQKAIDQLIESGTPFDLELMIQTSKGNSKWVRCIGKAEIIEEKCVRIFGSFQDIHDRKTAEIQLRVLTDNLPGVVVFQYLLFPDGTDALGSVSKGSYQLWGCSPEEAEQDISLVWDQTRAGGDYEKVKKEIEVAVKTKSKWLSQYRSVLPTGEVLMHLGSGTPSFLGDGTVVFNSFAMDITKEAKNEELLSEAIQMARIGSWEVNFHNNKVLWSEITHELHKTDPSSFIPDLEKSINFYREDFREMVQSRVKECIDYGKPFDFEAIIVTNKKNEVWVRAIGQAEMINGECNRIHGSLQDIHRAKSNEIQIREILESISDAFYALDANWNFTYFNKEAENLLKKSSEEVMGGNIWEIFSPAKGTALEKVYRKVASSGKSENFEYLYPGDGCWYELAVYPSSGGVASYFKNIDERRKAAQELEKAYKEKNEILESIGDAFFAVDDNWIVTYWNKQAEEILGRLRKDVLGKNLWEEFPDAIDSDFYRQYHKAMETGETVNFEEYYITLEMWIEVSVYPSENGLSIYFKDITLKKEADIRLLEANERFELVTKATDDAIWDWDIENDTFYRSQNIYKFFGKEAPTTLTIKEFWNDSFHPDDLKTIKESISKALKDKQTERWEMEYRILNEIGNTVHVIDKGLIIRDGSGKALRMIGAITDITELKRADVELIRQAEFINAMTDNPLAAIVACNADGELTLFNKTAKEWHGVDAMKVTQDKWAENYDLYRKDGINLLDKYEIPLVKAFNGEKVENDEIIIKKKSEKARIVICNGSSFHDNNGKKLGAVVIMTDITERKKAEKELIENENYLRTILDNEPECVKVLNSKGELLSMNPAGLVMLEADNEQQVLGQRMTDLVNKEYQLGFNQLSKEVFKGNSGSFEFEITGIKGGCRWLETHAVPLKDSTGKIVNLLGVTRDITERKKAERELLAINEKLSIQTKELQRSNEDLEQFAFISSHDLQEPLRMISGFMDQLKRKYSDQLDDKAQQYIYFATDGAKRMKQIILDLLLYSRANKPSEELEEVDLNNIISEYTQLRAKLIAEKKVTFSVDKLPILQVYRAPITQIFNSLLDNAIRYARENVPPNIEIKVKDKESFWEFAIEDNGIGIDKEFYDKIFVIFQRLHNRKESDGTGIGLSITKRCVQFLGGEIWLESTVGEGTTFYFTIAKK